MTAPVIRVIHGDCLDVLPRLKAEGVVPHACATDPPYHLASITKRFGAANAAPAKAGKTGAYARASRGFMGKQWDGGDIAFRPETWRLVFDLLPPGGHLLAFAGSRTYHRMACAIEDAGFELRDSLAWLYGTGFPKTKNVLKPAMELIAMARRPMGTTVAANVLAYGVGNLNIEACRVGERERPKITDPKRTKNTYGAIDHPGGKLLPDARWPANVLHDGSAEVVRLFPDSGNGNGPRELKRNEKPERSDGYGLDRGSDPPSGQSFGNQGSAARFFYSAKADADERLLSMHPTIKPVDVIAWLIRLVTPPRGLVLDPFAGSGTTGMACMREGMGAILVEREAEYITDIEARLRHVRGDDLPLFAEPDLFGGAKP